MMYYSIMSRCFALTVTRMNSHSIDSHITASQCMCVLDILLVRVVKRSIQVLHMEIVGRPCHRPEETPPFRYGGGGGGGGASLEPEYEIINIY